jgi:hypothetical protein
LELNNLSGIQRNKAKGLGVFQRSFRKNELKMKVQKCKKKELIGIFKIDTVTVTRQDSEAL